MLPVYHDISRDKPADVEAFWEKFISDRVAAYADFIRVFKLANPAATVVVIVPWYNPVEDVEPWLTAHCMPVTPEIRPYLSRRARDWLVDRFAAAVRAVPADKFIDIRRRVAPEGRILNEYRPTNLVDHHLSNGIQKLLIAEGIFSYCGTGNPMPVRREYVPRCN